MGDHLHHLLMELGWAKKTSPKIKGGEKGNYLLSFDPGADDSFFEVQNRGSS